jgi:hypothetical protein
LDIIRASPSLICDIAQRRSTLVEPSELSRHGMVATLSQLTCSVEGARRRCADLRQHDTQLGLERGATFSQSLAKVEDYPTAVGSQKALGVSIGVRTHDVDSGRLPAESIEQPVDGTYARQMHQIREDEMPRRTEASLRVQRPRKALK